MADHILDVDLLAFERGNTAQRAAVVDGVMRSLQVGFVYTSHDLSETLIDEVYGQLEEFFAQPPEVKQSFVAPGTHGQTGYTGLLVETAAKADVPDWKEMINWALDIPDGHPLKRRFPRRYMQQVIPDVPPTLPALLRRFHETLVDLQKRFLRIIALGIGCGEDVFEPMLTMGAALSRAIHYPAMQLAPSQEHVWAGEHGDINLITALPRATARGLQVRTIDGWIDAVAPAGRVILNTGIMLEHITNGVIKTGIHRVVADPAQPGDRFSVVQFLHPTPWTILAPLASCISNDHPQRYAAIEAGDLLDEVLWQINLVDEGRRVQTS